MAALPPTAPARPPPAPVTGGGTARRPSVAALVGAAALALLVPLLPSVPAAAAGPTVALVGSLQSELGCPGDWQPECAATELAPVDGEPGVCRATFDVPAGQLRVQGRAERLLGRELRRRRRAGRRRHRADGARRARDLHLRRRDPRDQRRRRARLAGRLRRRRRSGCARARSPGTCPTTARAGPTGCSGRPRAGWSRRTGPSPAAPPRRSTLRGGAQPPALRRGLPAPRRVRRARGPRRRCSAGCGACSPASSRSPRTTPPARCRPPPACRSRACSTTSTPARARRTLGPTWQGPTPRLAVWAPTAKRVALLLQTAGERRRAARRRCAAAATASGGARATRRWRDAALPLRGRGVRADDAEQVVTNVVTDPYSLGAHHRLARARCWSTCAAASVTPSGWKSLRKPAFRPDGRRRSTSCTCATSRSATRPSRPRTAAPTWPSPTAAATACATCARSPTRAWTTSTCCRSTTSPRSRRTAPSRRRRPATWPRTGRRARSSRPA